MNTLKLWLCAGTAAMTLGLAGAAAADSAPAAAPPAPSPAPYPAMGATIPADPNPPTFDAGPLGKVIVSGVVSGLAAVNDNPGVNFWDGTTNKSSFIDFTNGLVTVQKADGPIQFVVQAGAYSFPALGAGYIAGTDQPEATFGFLPVGYVKIVPNSSFNVEIGQLPTLVGAELPFTYQNINIERGLLWNQEPLISRGIQANYSNGPWALSFSWNDGYYSNEYTSLSGLVTYTFKNTDTLTFVGSGNLDTNFQNCGPACAPFATPLLQHEGYILDLIYNHSQGPWTITPYIQYLETPNLGAFFPSQSIFGGAVLAKYSFNANWSVAGRLEYEQSNGGNPLETLSVLYGPGSSAWSFTITPTYTKGIFFARLEGSYTGIGSGTPGFELGSAFDATHQWRGMLEAGFNF